MTDAIIDRTRRLIAACETIDDFLCIRPGSLGIAVCGLDSEGPRTQRHAAHWLSYWGPKLDVNVWCIPDRKMRLAYAKWVEAGLWSEFSARSIETERRRLGVDSADKFAKFRADVARELNIPSYMLGVT